MMTSYAESIRCAFLHGTPIDSLMRECRQAAVAIKGDCSGGGFLWEVTYTLEDGSKVRLENPYGYDWPGRKPNVVVVL